MPDEWCARERVHRSHVRLQDTGIEGATFGVEEGGVLSWGAPQDAGSVDRSRVDESANVTKEVITAFRLRRAAPGALRWVLDGDGAWRGRLYEVGADGLARYVSPAHRAADGAHFPEARPNVMPVSRRQIEDFATRGLLGPDL